MGVFLILFWALISVLSAGSALSAQNTVASHGDKPREPAVTEAQCRSTGRFWTGTSCESRSTPPSPGSSASSAKAGCEARGDTWSETQCLPNPARLAAECQARGHRWTGYQCVMVSGNVGGSDQVAMPGDLTNIAPGVTCIEFLPGGRSMGCGEAAALRKQQQLQAVAQAQQLQAAAAAFEARAAERARVDKVVADLRSRDRVIEQRRQSQESNVQSTLDTALSELLSEEAKATDLCAGEAPWGEWRRIWFDREVEFLVSLSGQRCATDPQEIRIRISNYNDRDIQVRFALRTYLANGQVISSQQLGGRVVAGFRSPVVYAHLQPIRERISRDPRDYTITRVEVGAASVCSLSESANQTGYIDPCRP